MRIVINKKRGIKFVNDYQERKREREKEEQIFLSI